MSHYLPTSVQPGSRGLLPFHGLKGFSACSALGRVCAASLDGESLGRIGQKKSNTSYKSKSLGLLENQKSKKGWWCSWRAMNVIWHNQGDAIDAIVKPAAMILVMFDCMHRSVGFNLPFTLSQSIPSDQMLRFAFSYR